MFQVRFHGRGGQGVVTAAELLSIAAFNEGKHAQAFPSFGSERMGAPVVSYCRIANTEIRSREPVSQPDALVIQDPTLIHSVDLFAGLNGQGYVLINSQQSFEELGIDDFASGFPHNHFRDVGASEIARKHIGRPLPNAALLGSLAAMSGEVSIEAVEQAISQKFPGQVGAANIAAAREAYDVAVG
ncbi:2-oxoacid:acceptor oxidoreductase family protein [uncultured Roseibium sp.]|uniref:2-oxoacid:acceptor oxidoreductase family protein n=1 Tax=uncultured Roseibium sp. TaxID=1936171 RepID=UPI002624E945|nr:2-oxoacid:acceptor oxidoreductase family protein [uncultured Roseibium sp.]